MPDLTDYRRTIDELDRSLVALFEKRMDTARAVAAYKKEHDLPVLQEGREREVISRALAQLKDPAYAPYLRRFMQHMMDLSKTCQRQENRAAAAPAAPPRRALALYGNPRARAGFQGVAGAFSEEALGRVFGEKVQKTAYPSVEAVFQALADGEIDYGVLPIENSTTGAISRVYDLLSEHGFLIVAETYVKVEQYLLGLPGARVEEVREVYSHPQGLEQCGAFLAAHPQMRAFPYHNTAMSARLVHDLGDATKAAIASLRAGALYALEPLGPAISDRTDNTTRFVVVSRERVVPEGADKASIVLSLDDRAGTLYGLLRAFAENDVNLVKIESRPMHSGAWTYLLYVDFEGDVESDGVRAALSELRARADYFAFLGAYKKEAGK